MTTTIETYCHPSMDAQERIADRLTALEKGVESKGAVMSNQDTDVNQTEKE